MSWVTFLTELKRHFAVGRHGRYEDGVWPDITYRQRFADAVWRVESVLAESTVGEPLASVLQDLTQLDDPDAVLDALWATHPGAGDVTLSGADRRWFIHALCARPGKPVNFVPVIDKDVRRWFKSDSLWQAHDDRLDADAVLVIPGPAAVKGITQVDEPVATILGRFEAGAAAALAADGVVASPIPWRRRPARPAGKRRPHQQRPRARCAPRTKTPTAAGSRPSRPMRAAAWPAPSAKRGSPMGAGCAQARCGGYAK